MQLRHFWTMKLKKGFNPFLISVPDPNPDPTDPHVFGPRSGPDPLVRGMDPDPAPAPDPI